MHEGKYIQEEPGRVKITQNGDKFKVDFKEVKMDDHGEIKVVIHNKLGEAAEAATLKVIRKLLPLIFFLIEFLNKLITCSRCGISKTNQNDAIGGH